MHTKEAAEDNFYYLPYEGSEDTAVQVKAGMSPYIFRENTSSKMSRIEGLVGVKMKPALVEQRKKKASDKNGLDKHYHPGQTADASKRTEHDDQTIEQNAMDPPTKHTLSTEAHN